MQNKILDIIEKDQLKTNINAFKAGDNVKVHVRIKEGNKERIQLFEGLVISLKGSGTKRTFTVRKISYGIGVERTFLINSPLIATIEVIRKNKVRRAKLYYMRDRRGKSARLKEIRAPKTAAKKVKKTTTKPVAKPVTKTVAKTTTKQVVKKVTK